MRFIISLGLKIFAGIVTLGGIFQGYVALKEIITHHMPPEKKKKQLFILLWFLVAGICVYGASSPSLDSLFPDSSLVATSTPTIASSSPTPNLTATSTSSTTATVVIQPSATVSSGLIKKNIMLTCHTCTSDPILATLNSIQIDTAKGRMIWDITLENVASGPNYQYNITKYDLQTSNSLTPISGTSSQQYGYFSGSVPDDVQVVFTTIPPHNVTYTFTLVVNQNFYAGTTVSFDPIDITF